MQELGLARGLRLIGCRRRVVLGQPPSGVVVGVEADGRLALTHPCDFLPAQRTFHRGDFTDALRIPRRATGQRRSMKKLLITTLVALAIPAAASAHHHHSLYARLSGTGTLASAGGTMLSANLGAGTFHATVAASGSATTRTGEHGTLSCMPATATVTLTGSSTVTATLTGKTCTFTPAGTTTAAGSMFWGRNSTTNMKAFLVAKTGGSVRGAVFAGVDRTLFAQFSQGEDQASSHTGDCDH
jgi:hypothetical protein